MYLSGKDAARCVQGVDQLARAARPGRTFKCFVYNFRLKMSRFLQEEAILDVLEAEYESSCSEIEDVENVSIHETNSEEDADLYDHQSHKLPLPPLDQPLGVRNWRDLQVSHDYLEDIPVQFPRRRKFTDKDNIKKWQVCTPPQNVRTRAHNIVLTVPGRIREGRNCSSIVEACNYIFPPEFITKIVTYTNIYIEKQKEKYSRVRDSKSTNEIELHALFGLLYYIGRVRGAPLEHLRLMGIRWNRKYYMHCYYWIWI
ncbi:hypothetical protein ACJJTC_003319 [Scirpophaga incertulas]